MPKKYLKPAIFFDLDGTLVDTERTAMAVVVNYFKRYGYDVSPTDQVYLIGRPWIDAAEHLVSRYPISEKDSGQVEKDLLADYRKSIAVSIHAIRGSVEAVRTLSSSFRLAIVSGSHRQDIETVVRTLQISDCFEQLLGFENYSQGKPSPAPYLEALRLFDISPAQAVVFEDSDVGVRSAIAAGIRVVTVGEETPNTPPRTPTPWSIPNFLGIDSNWMKERFFAQMSDS